LCSDRKMSAIDNGLSQSTVNRFALTTQVRILDTESKNGSATYEIGTTLGQKRPDGLHFECVSTACGTVLSTNY